MSLIAFNATVTTSPIADLIEFLDSQNEIVQRIGDDVASRFVPALEYELASNVPPRRRYPADYPNGKLPFDTPKQQKAYWASGGFGRGIPFVRSGSLEQSWKVDITNAGGVFAIRVHNDADGAKYVYGSLSMNYETARKSQQRFHAATGWPLAIEIIQPVLADMIDAFAKRYKEELGQFGNKPRVRATGE